MVQNFDYKRGQQSDNTAPVTLQDLSTSISGPNLVAAMFLPGFGLRVFAELATISYQTYRELAPVPTCGHVNIRGIAKGPRWVAGSIVFIYFDKHAILDILDYHKTSANARGTSSNIPDMHVLDQRLAMLAALAGDLGGKLKAMEKRTANMISNVHGASEADGLLSLPGPIGTGMSDVFRALGAGTQATTEAAPPLEQSAIQQEIDETLIEIKRAAEITQGSQAGLDYDRWKRFSRMMSPDALPPFNVLLFGANEAGIAVRAGIYNIHIQTDGATMSVEDLVTEGVCQYMALAVDPIDPAIGSMARHTVKEIQQALSPADVNKRLHSFARSSETIAQYIDLTQGRAGLSPEIRANPDSAIKFDGRDFDVLVVDEGTPNAHVAIKFAAQTPSNSSILDRDLFPDVGVVWYWLMITPGAQHIDYDNVVQIVEPDDDNIAVRTGFVNNTEGKKVKALVIKIEPDQALEGDSNGVYDPTANANLNLSFETLDNLVRESEDVTDPDRPAYRVQTGFKVKAVTADSVPGEETLVEGFSNTHSTIQILKAG